MLGSLTFRTENMRRKSNLGFTNATDCADYLVRQGLPFRDAHRVVGQLVSRCLAEGKALNDLTLEEFRQYSPAFGEDIYTALEPETCVTLRNIPGGPAPEQVLRSIEAGRQALEGFTLE